jgi:hypothetical protein
VQAKESFCDFFSVVFNPEFVSEDGKVDYAKVRRQKNNILSIMDRIANMSIGEYALLESSDQAAFWINTYNICVIKVVYDNYPIVPSRIKMIFYPAQSIMQIDKPFTDKYFEVMGNEYNLEQIEKQVLSAYGDAKALFALSEGALSSPRLKNSPYRGLTLDDEINKQLQSTLARSDYVRVDSRGKEIWLSRFFREKLDLFSSYGTRTKFTERSEDERAVINFLSQYNSVTNWAIYGKAEYRIKYGYFDWRLNDTVIMN